MSPLRPLLPQRSAALNCHITPLSLHPQGQHHSTVICLTLLRSQSKVSTTQLFYDTLYPHLPQRSASLNCHMSPLNPLLAQRSATLNCRFSPLYSLLPQRSAPLNCHMPLFPALNQKSAPLNCNMSPLRPLLPQRSAALNCHITPLYPLHPQGQYHSTVICPTPSTPFSIKDQHHSTVICLTLLRSQSKVSTTQLFYVPLYPHLPQSPASLNCHMSPLYPLLAQRSATLNCRISPLYSLLPQRSAPLNCHMPPRPRSQSNVSTTQL